MVGVSKTGLRVQGRVTVKEVARRAGVSVGTVSRVLNGFENVSDENERRVRQAMQELEYHACASARMLATRRSGSRAQTGNIGVYLPEASHEWSGHPLFAAYMSGVEQSCAARGYHVLFEFGGAGDGAEGESVSEMAGLPRFILENKVDGILVKGSRRLPEWVRRGVCPVPMVGLSLNEPDIPIPQVMPDNQAAGWQAAKHAWEMGHRRIAFVNPDREHHMFIHRQLGVESFLRERDAYRPEWIVTRRVGQDLPSQPQNELPSLGGLLDELLHLPLAQRPTAIIAANDWNAAGLYRALAERGLRVPGDLSVIGIDNDLTTCGSLLPPLTSYEMPFTRAAKAAADILLGMIESGSGFQGDKLQLVRGALVERHSVRRLEAEA